jgi:pilus assembly protein Flp/PilA
VARHFSGLDLATGKFPETPVLAAQPSALEQYPARRIDQRHRYDENGCRKILQGAASSKGILKRDPRKRARSPTAKGMAWVMITFLASLYRDTRGATAIEYGLICAMIVIAVIGAIQGLGQSNSGGWGAMSSKATTAMQGATAS